MTNSHARSDWEQQLRSCCKEGRLITKKQLEELTGLSDTTITKSIQACLLNTAKPSYTPQEIEEVFVVARKMLEGSTGDGRRYSYKDVEQHFQMKSAGVDESKRPSKATAGYTEYAPGQALQDLAKGVSDGIAGTLQPVISAALQQYIQDLPMIIVSQMNAQIAKGTVRRVTQEAGRLLVSERNFLFESGTDDSEFEEFIEIDSDDIEGDHTDNEAEEEEGI